MLPTTALYETRKRFQGKQLTLLAWNDEISYNKSRFLAARFDRFLLWKMDTKRRTHTCLPITVFI